MGRDLGSCKASLRPSEESLSKLVTKVLEWGDQMLQGQGYPFSLVNLSQPSAVLQVPLSRLHAGMEPVSQELSMSHESWEGPASVCRAGGGV